MPRLRRLARLHVVLLCAAVATLVSTHAGAQIIDHPVEISAQAGLAHFDARAYMHDAPAYGGSVGWRFAPWLSLEGAGIYSASTRDSGSASEAKRDFYWAGADLRWGLRPADSRTQPFALTGIGYGSSKHEGLHPEVLARGTARVGLGLLVKLNQQRLYLRVQATDMLFVERDQDHFYNYTAITAGLHYVLGGKERDVDHDRVRDWLDACPETPIGAKVDAKGCPMDGDHDGIFDGLDQCPDTPPGCKVGVNGCSIDTDGDGVCDSVDVCPDTPKGAVVDPKGCPVDSDADSVYDGLDQCPGTPKGCTIDLQGCPADADSDGVCDGLDVCPNTPAGVRVTPTGCPLEVSPMEIQLLETGTIRIGNIQFDSGKSTLKPASFAVLDSVGSILRQYPTLKIEIGGHTDNQGSAAKNQAISEARAKAVSDYLRAKIAGFETMAFSSKGYGFSRPVAPNSAALGRSKNRRVEFKVLNTEALRVEREKRSYLFKH